MWQWWVLITYVTLSLLINLVQIAEGINLKQRLLSVLVFLLTLFLWIMVYSLRG